MAWTVFQKFWFISSLSFRNLYHVGGGGIREPNDVDFKLFFKTKCLF